MTGKDEKTGPKPKGQKPAGMKSTGAKAPLRSRGFLSQPGGSGAPVSGDDATSHHRSRGARQISANTDGKPQDLTVKPAIKPFRLEEK